MRLSGLRFEKIILYEDRNYLLVNKPPFLSTLEDRNDPHNLLDLCRRYDANAQVCHRLDKDTSGILAVARNPSAYRFLNKQFEDREVKKKYHAVADGLHRFTDLEVNKPILKLSDGTVRISREGKDAITILNTAKVFKDHTLVECSPVTGRMHQIRIHLASAGAPITGDEVYGGKPFFLSAVKRGYNLKKETEELPLMKRMALHAFSIAFTNPDGGVISAEAAYPKDLQALLKQLFSNTK